MTIKELKAKIANLPDNAVVYTYSSIDEGDCSADCLYVCNKDSLSTEGMYQINEYYCKGDSGVALHLLENPEDTVVVIAGCY